MRSEKNRSFLPLSLVPALLVVSAIAVLATQEVRTQSVRATNWSDPATWPNKKVPVAGDKVDIGQRQGRDPRRQPSRAGRPLHRRQAHASPNDADLELTHRVDHAARRAGDRHRSQAPHTRKATITLTNNVKDEDVMVGMGDRGIMISGGTLNLHGDRTNTWTKLSATPPTPAAPRSRCWMPRAGRSATRSFSPRRTSIRVRPSGARSPPSAATRITLDKKLDYMHFGKITFDVDERGEVGLLTRNIKIQASADAEQSLTSAATSWRWSSSNMYRRGRRAEPHGPAHDAGALSDPLAPGRRRARASTSRTPPSTTPTTAA